MRLSKSPITNLHLLNDRLPLEEIRPRLSLEAWEALKHTCRRVAACFPDNLMVAPDIAISPDFKRHHVLEVNAFGDLLHDCYHEGRTPCDQQIACLYRKRLAHV